MIIADLHIHGRYSQGTSKELSISKLSQWAKVKGVSLLGTGDFTHPQWFEEIRSELKEDGTGILKSGKGQNFLLQTEISLIYSQGGMGRRIHVLLLAPDMSTAVKITDYFKGRGRIDYDGRPIFKIPCPELVKDMRSISSDIEVIPAHIWTPWFAMFGSKSGFDTVQECFGDQAEYIHAIETGLSSDPQMNWRLSQLDNMQIISFSDLHSFWPWRIGREATVFDTEMRYDAILKAIRTGEGLHETIEVDPNYGKYHLDGHRKCDICMYPIRTKQNNGICPVCGKPLTIGVLNRIEELADRPEDYHDPKRPGFRTVIPLSELISLSLGKGITTKAVWAEYDSLTKDTTEMEVLLYMHEGDIVDRSNEDMARLILKNRQGKIKVRPGYDGEYGKPQIGEKTKGLDEFI